MPHRAYGSKHKRTRAVLLPQAIGTPCPRCGHTMEAWQPLDLGHSDPKLKAAGLPGDRIEHRYCNRSAGNGTALTQPANHTPSRTW